MVGDILTIQNGSEIQQNVYDMDGKRHTLEGYQVLPLPKQIARLFLDERSKYVQVYQPIKIPPGRPGEPLIYVANVTGNPFLPEKVDYKYFDKATKLEKIEKIPNPLRIPRPVRREYHLAQEIIEAPSGEKTTMSHPPIQVAIPPWHRLPVPETCAEWLTRRDAQQDEHEIGKLIYARAPSEFEPNETWELHEILVYARMVDDGAIGWVPEREVWKAIEVGEDVKIAEFKIKLLQTLFFRMVDERWGLPTKAAFEMFLKKVMDEVTAPKTAKRGVVSAPAST